MGFAEVGKKASSRQLISGEQTTSGRDAQLIAHPPHCCSFFVQFHDLLLGIFTFQLQG